jgi:molecular chaperone HtpG
LHYDPQYKDRLAKLVRYGSSKQDGLVSLDEYVDRMAEGQPAIYYAQGTSRAVLEASPHLEAINKQGYEVLFMTDPIDQWAVTGLGPYRDKPLVSAMTADLKLDDKEGEGEGDKDKSDAASAELKPLLAHMRAVLQDKVEKVQVSERLTDSPVCLVVPEGGLQPHIERLLRAQSADVPATKRIMEINPNHALVQSLRELHSRDSDNADVREWIWLLYEQALLAEGSPADNPVQLATRLTKLLQSAAAAATAA